MVGSEYSPYKSVHHIDRLMNVRDKGYCVPVTIHLAPTTYCNCHCYYCYVQDYNRIRVQLDKDVLFDFLRESAKEGVKAVEITGGGEPTIYPYFDELLLFCHKIGLDTGVVSNGYHLNVDSLQYAKWLRISIDTFDPETYYLTRKSSFPDLSNIKLLSNGYNVITGASCVITKQNYNTIYEFAKRARQLGFNNVWFKGVEGVESIPLSLEKLVTSQLSNAKNLSNDSFRVFVGDVFNRNEQHGKAFSRCMFQHMAMMVYADGNVYYCCSLQGRKGYSYANIYKDSFADVIRKKIELPVKDCPINCFWENKNRFMDYIVCSEPRHINFM